jgi:hypothetical protein
MLLFNFDLEYAHKKVLKKEMGLNLLEDNINTINRSIETLTGFSKEVGLKENVEETKYMVVSRHQSAGQIWDIKIRNRSFQKWHNSNIWERQ